MFIITGLKLRIAKSIRGIKYWFRIMLKFGVSDNKNISFSSLEKVCVETVESGSMTKALAILINKSAKYLTTNQFLEAIDGNLRKKLT